MRTTLSAMLVVLLTAGGIGQLTAVSDKSVVAILDGKELELEQLYATYWQIQYQLEQGDTSVSDKDVNRKLRDVINDPDFLHALKAASFDDPVLQRRRQLFLE